jgi:PKD repeat protein
MARHQRKGDSHFLWCFLNSSVMNAQTCILTLCLFCISSSAFSQWHDAVWLYGITHYGSPLYDRFYIDFTQEPRAIHKHEREMNINGTKASIADSLGNLIAYTNGLYLANMYHEKIEGSDSLSTGSIADEWNDVGLPFINTHLILPWPKIDDVYILFHMNVDNVSGPFVVQGNPLCYTVVNMTLNGGNGAVVAKRIPVIDDANLNLSFLAATKHANGRDWWIITSEKSKNMFHRILLSPEGVTLLPAQYINPIFPNLTSRGLFTFSPDGNILVRYEVGHGAYIYHFNRCTGEFNNFAESIILPGTHLGGGVSFSPNSRFFYLISNTYILQFDTWDVDIPSTMDTVAIFNGYEHPDVPTFTANFFTSQLGPDGRIYINTTLTTKALHSIERPNRKGAACKVLQPGLLLPFINVYTMPNYPNFRLGPIDGSPCDTLGYDNHPLADFRYEWPDSTQHPLLVEFIDNSFYEPTDWYWDFGDSKHSTEVNPLHVFPTAGTYTVCLTVSNQNSSNTVCRDVTVQGIPTSTQEVADTNLLHLFPNPTSTSFTLTLPAAAQEGMQVRITDMYGREVSLPGQSKIRAGTWQHTLDASHLPAGVYWVSVHRDGGEVYGGKLVVQ